MAEPGIKVSGCTKHGGSESIRFMILLPVDAGLFEYYLIAPGKKLEGLVYPSQE
jgi:hypothetical protein